MRSSASEEPESCLVAEAKRDHANPPAPAWAVWSFATCVGLWTGGVVFLSVAVMPILFMNLEPSEAGRIAALIFPVYFRAGLALGLLGCISSFVLMRTGSRPWRVVFGLLVVMTIAQGWSTLVVHPEMTRIRGVDVQIERFQDLHRLSVRLNGVVLIGGLLLVGGGALLLSREKRSPREASGKLPAGQGTRPTA